jgi:NAD+ synthetase
MILDYQLIFDRMVEWTANYLRENKLKSMVLGISGGIDSTLCAAICYEVCERYKSEGFKFYGVSLPCSTNTQRENDAAQLTMDAFIDKDCCWTENLEKEYLLMRATCEIHTQSTSISQGNIKARLRMIYLYNIASVTNGLVIGTSNLTEEYTGFFTIAGDGQADIAPISNLWKHEIFELVKYLSEYVYTTYADEKKKKALTEAYNITPTDGNGVMAGGDLAQIAPGFTYNDVDDMLYVYLDATNKASAVAELKTKYPADTVDMVIRRHNNSRFKRHHIPLIVEPITGELLQNDGAKLSETI